MDDEEAGREAGQRWADDLIEAKGLKWLRAVEIDAPIPPWDAFARCVDPGGAASDREIFGSLFGVEAHSAEYIAGFVKSALHILQEVRRQPQ